MKKSKSLVCARCGNECFRHVAMAFDLCYDCSVQHGHEGANAGTRLRAARAAGLVPHFNGCACADCGKPAQCHDHRDYTKPYQVEPVCFKCNSRRGLALDSRLREYKKITQEKQP